MPQSNRTARPTSDPSASRPERRSLLNRVRFFLFGRRPVVDRRGRVRIRLTKGGWIFALYTIAVGAGAVNTGNNLVYLLFGVFVGLLTASGFLSIATIRGLEISASTPRHAVAGESVLVGVRLANRKKFFPSISITVELVGTQGGRPAIVKKFVAAVAAGRSFCGEALYFPTTRGFFRLETIEVATSFPFGLVRRTKVVSSVAKAEEGMIVFPKSIALDDGTAIEVTRDVREGRAANNRGDGYTIHGVREFRERDSPKRVHWKATAKRDSVGEIDPQRWLVRELSTDEEAAAWIVWPSAGILSELDQSKVEAFISFSASIVRFLQERNRPVKMGIESGLDWTAVVAPKGRDPKFEVLEFLGLVDSRNVDGGLGGLYLRTARRPRDMQTRVDAYALFTKWERAVPNGRAA